jgi:hypothetical protein
LSCSLSRPGAGRSTTAATRGGGGTACLSSPDKISASLPILWRPRRRPPLPGPGRSRFQALPSIDYLRLYYRGGFSGALVTAACDAWLAVLFYLLGDTASVCHRPLGAVAHPVRSGLVGINCCPDASQQCNSLLEIITVDAMTLLLYITCTVAFASLNCILLLESVFVDTNYIAIGDMMFGGFFEGTFDIQVPLNIIKLIFLHCVGRWTTSACFLARRRVSWLSQLCSCFPIPQQFTQTDSRASTIEEHHGE